MRRLILGIGLLLAAILVAGAFVKVHQYWTASELAQVVWPAPQTGLCIDKTGKITWPPRDGLCWSKDGPQ